MYKQSVRRKSKDIFKIMFRVRFLLLHFSLSEWPFKYCEWTYCIPKFKIDSWHFDILQVVLDFVLENHHAVCVCGGRLFSELFLPFFDLHWDSRLLLCEISKNHGDNFLFPIQQYPCHLQHFLISQYFKDAQQVHIPYPIHYHF